MALGLQALFRLGTEFYRLILSTAPNGAIDLRLRYEETHRWFAGEPIYTVLERITYPPAAYLGFWPLLGWLPLGLSRVLWAATTVAMLAWLVHLMIRASGASSTPERVFVALIVLSMNAVAVTVGNGQLVIHLLPPMLAALLLLRDRPEQWTRDLAVAGLAVVALTKPTLTLPFLWVAVLSARTIRPLLLTGALYAGATLVSSAFQQEGPVELIPDWIRQSGRYVGEGGYGDVQTVFHALGFDAGMDVAPVILLAALGLWTWKYRHADFWILVGVAALVARFWTYHRNYDDVLILLPLMALLRLAAGHGREQGPDPTATVLCAVGVVSMLEIAGRSLHVLYAWGHVGLWLAMLGYLWVAASSQVKRRNP